MLWGLQDEVAHHKRRYRLRGLLAAVHAAGLVSVRAFYFNFVLFVPILATRRLMRLMGVQIASENELNPGWLNRMLLPIFHADILAAPRFRFPFGVSALVLALRPNESC